MAAAHARGVSFKDSVDFLDFIGSDPSPVQAPAAVVLDEVTNGYVPKSTSKRTLRTFAQDRFPGLLRLV
jgi:hypothetical protein